MCEETLPQTAMLVNAFTVDSVHLLNSFAHKSHERLDGVDETLCNLEMTLTLLEARLQSVEGLADAPQEQPVPAHSAFASLQPAPSQAVTTTETTAAAPPLPLPPPPLGHAPRPPPPPPPPPPLSAQPQEAPAASESAVIRNRDSFLYACFFKMLAVGVPHQAVCNKMALQGLSSAVLDAPDAPFTGG